MNRYKRVIIGIMLGICFGAGFFWTFRIHRHRIPFGDRYIELNAAAVPNPEKTYHLRLWDYQWPIGQSKKSYHSYLEQAVGEFQKKFPNIKVEIRLLDLMTGPTLLSGALQNNTAPDVYCSAYAIPPFDPERQIPVGVFLSAEEIREYFPSLQKLTTLNRYLCYLPRWSAPGFWLGNRILLEKCGISVTQIQRLGWSWTDLSMLSQRLPANQTLLACNPAANGFFRQLVASSGQNSDLDVPIWNGQGVGAVLDFLTELKAGRKWTPIISPDCATRFFSGKALILAGVRPIFFPIAQQKLAAQLVAGETAVLPVPGRFPNGNLILTENSVIAVYRNNRTSGDDHLAAAAKLARFLSTYQNTTPWVEMMVIPASQAAASRWAQKTALQIGADQAGYMVDQLQKGRVLNLPDLPEYQSKIYPALMDFLAGKTTTTEAQALMFDE